MDSYQSVITTSHNQNQSKLNKTSTELQNGVHKTQNKRLETGHNKQSMDMLNFFIVLLIKLLLHFVIMVHIACMSYMYTVSCCTIGNTAFKITFTRTTHWKFRSRDSVDLTLTCICLYLDTKLSLKNNKFKNLLDFILSKMKYFSARLYKIPFQGDFLLK